MEDGVEAADEGAVEARRNGKGSAVLLPDSAVVRSVATSPEVSATWFDEDAVEVLALAASGVLYATELVGNTPVADGATAEASEDIASCAVAVDAVRGETDDMPPAESAVELKGVTALDSIAVVLRSPVAAENTAGGVAFS